MNNRIRLSKSSAFLLLLCAITVIAWIPRLKGPIDLRMDGAAYYILGTSIAEGKGYKLLNEPGEINSTLHQPLLPVFVAVHQWFLRTSDPVIVGQGLRITFFFAFIIYILAVYSMLRLRLAPVYAFIGGLLCLLHLNTQYLSDILYAELLFGITTTLFFVCYKSSHKTAYGILAILFAYASYGLRAVGVALFAAWIGDGLLNKDFKKAIFRLAVTLIPIICWQSYIYSVESGSQYKNPAYEYQYADYMYPNVSYARNNSLIDTFAPEKGYITPIGRIERFAGNAAQMPIKLGESVGPSQISWQQFIKQIIRKLQLPLIWGVNAKLALLVLLILSLLVVAGVILKLKNRQWFVPLYVSAIVTMICLTPWTGSFGRYLMPLMPFLILCLFETFSFIKAKSETFLSGRWKYAGHIFAGSILFPILLVETLALREIYQKELLPVSYNDRSGQRVEYKLLFYYKPYKNLDEGLDWLMTHAEPDDIVAGSWSHWVYLRTGLKAVLPPFEPDAQEAQRLLDTVPVKYLLLEKNDFIGLKKYVAPVVQNAQNRWKLVFSTSDGELEIYERTSE